VSIRLKTFETAATAPWFPPRLGDAPLSASRPLKQRRLRLHHDRIICANHEPPQDL